MNATIATVLAERLPPGRVITDPDITARYCHDEAEWATVGVAAAVVRAKSTDEVRTTVRACLEQGVAVVPRGAGTGLSGGANALDGCVILSLEAMDEILEVDAVEGLVVVQPGVINATLRRALAEHGLWYPPDPASAEWSTIGGNVSTNAGGLCCVKYGVTGDYVLALEFVDGSGEAVRVGRRTAKGVVGYDLVSLLVGSEGTLGIITEVTLRVRALPPPAQTVVGYFDSLAAAGDAVRNVAEAGLTPSALELIDRECLLAVDAWKNMGLADEANAVLLARSDLPGGAGDAEAEAIRLAFESAGAKWAARSSDQEEAEMLFEARRLAYPAMERLGPVLTEDVCVPKKHVSEMLRTIEQIAERHDTRIANIAHAGDGNLHPLLITSHDDEAARLRAQAAFEDIIAAALALGGTVTGEHGVGLLKMGGMRQEVGPRVLALHRSVKDALDPDHVFNPGKVFDLA